MHEQNTEQQVYNFLRLFLIGGFHGLYNHLTSVDEVTAMVSMKRTETNFLCI